MPKKVRTRPGIPGSHDQYKVRPNYSGRPLPAFLARLDAWGNWQPFKPSRHREALLLDDAFLRSLGPTTRVLEIGFGTGRLADYLLRRTAVKPENYELLEHAAPEDGPFLKRRIFRMLREKKMPFTSANMWTHSYLRNQYDHVLVPEAYFPEYNGGWRAGLDGSQFSRLSGDQKRRVESEHLAWFVNRLAPSVRKGGSIRVSYFSWALTPEVQRKLSRRFLIRRTGAGIILDRK